MTGPRGDKGETGVRGEKGERGERGVEGPPGKLPVVKAWTEGVSYGGTVVTYQGATYQATKDTAQTPTGSEWICLAAAGGDAIVPVVCGVYSDRVKYAKLNVVSLNGGSFIAKKDDPGPCPGDGWQLVASQGKRGDKGEKGERGLRGETGATGAAAAPAPTISRWRIDNRRYVATPVMSDDSNGPPLELRSLFEQFQSETR